MREEPFSVVVQHSLQVVVGISPGIAGAPVADFEINNVCARSVDR
jgi:hypothetical protein